METPDNNLLSNYLAKPIEYLERLTTEKLSEISLLVKKYRQRQNYVEWAINLAIISFYLSFLASIWITGLIGWKQHDFNTMSLYIHRVVTPLLMLTTGSLIAASTLGTLEQKIKTQIDSIFDELELKDILAENKKRKEIDLLESSIRRRNIFFTNRNGIGLTSETAEDIIPETLSSILIDWKPYMLHVVDPDGFRALQNLPHIDGVSLPYYKYMFNIIKYAKNIDNDYPSISLVEYVLDRLFPQELVYILGMAIHEKKEKHILPSAQYYELNMHVIERYSPWPMNNEKWRNLFINQNA